MWLKELRDALTMLGVTIDVDLAVHLSSVGRVSMRLMERSPNLEIG